MKRDEFFSKAFKLVVGKGLHLLTDNPIINTLEAFAPLQKQRPPGASQQNFRELCTGCDACMKACPVNVIMIEDLESRLPLIYPDQAPCIHCEGYPCIQACPTGALHAANGFELRLL